MTEPTPIDDRLAEMDRSLVELDACYVEWNW